ncbi:MAG TPA: PIN domain-containing protein [Caulobacteraceae bacterium]|nr:PIN domain-containing protein [Caulobacteraceae bacterium]
MISADSSSLIAYLQGESGGDIDLIERAIIDGELVFAPPVITELRAGAVPNDELETLLTQTPRLVLDDGLWDRAGRNRRLLIEKGLKARFADAVIAQCCVDADVALIARDRDYRHFERWCGLKLAA